MSSPLGNQPPRRSGAPSSGSPYNTPRHGRIPSRTGIEPMSPPQAQQPSMPNHRAPPKVHHLQEEEPTPLQRWNGASVNPFMRWAYTVLDARGSTRPNYNYDPDMNNAIYLSETIDDFDRNPSLVHELVLRIANPELGHPSMDWIRANRSLVDILLYRHYQRYGGLMLPPTAAALRAMEQHEAAIAAARAAGVLPNEYPHITFPAFGPPPPRDGEVGSPKGKGKMTPGKPSGSPPGKGNLYGSIGDRGEFGRGGASGGGVYY
ncbi:hypothetical protein BKA58DRAFT_417061 [Alternaria rosae]|uniref:uncharacterized protein n=1 Tax=Alternaria rosae TaxID=1187941 RepID=UPI001E8E87DE|nr:uncharacterized protein BKA58DRAFT_417061 [Alternaria rosae]KAH6883267.1 hypothetical protein BKA58DRAFT_417061 [Alternaria rosae]